MILATFFILSEIIGIIARVCCVCLKKKNKLYIQFGIKLIASPQTISKMPTVRRYHLDGILKSNTSDSGNTLEYFTYSFLCKKKMETNNYICVKIHKIVDQTEHSELECIT